MRPELFHIGSLPIYSYGVMLMLGFLGALYLARFLARRSGIDPEVFVNAGLIALVSGIVGARLSHVLENLGTYTRSTAEVATWKPGQKVNSLVATDKAATYKLFTIDSSGAKKEAFSLDLPEDTTVGFAREGPGMVGIAGERRLFIPDAAAVWQRPVTAKENFLNAINIRSGGLTFYGGFILATACTIAYGVFKRVPVRLGMDIVAPCVMVGLAFGRIGCLLNGCCYGAECHLPWGVSYPYGSNAYVEEVEKGKINPPAELRVQTATGVAPLAKARVEQDAHLAQVAAGQHSLERHPAQLYSTITALLIAALLVAYFTLRPSPGRVFALMLLVEAPSRFLLEMLRAEPAVVGRGTGKLDFLPPMSFSMVLSVGLLALGVVLWFAFGPKRDRSNASPAGTPAVA